MVKQKSAKSELPAKQKLVFKLITLIIPILIFLVIEGLLKLTGYGDNLNLFIQNPTKGYEDYMIVNPTVGKKYFQKFEYTAPANDIFLKEKPENVFRIFVMGSSTVFGFPYDRDVMFSRILDKRLKEAYPNFKIEVVNTAITAINSFTLLDYAPQIMKYNPDAVLIYAGHNEFYGAFGVGSNETMGSNRLLTKLHIKLMDLRIYQLLRNSISGVAQKIASKKDKVHGTLMKRIVADKDILLNSDDYNLAMDCYQQNMSELLQVFKKQNVPIFYSEVVSNVKDIEPFNSVKSEDLELAIDVFKKAKEYELAGEYDNALKYYYKAKDLDCIRFRASEEVNEIIKNLTDEYKATFVTMESEFQNHSPNRLIGDNLMTEHVHPNIQGNFLMAEVFFNYIYEAELIAHQSTVNLSSQKYFERNYGITILDSLHAVHNVKQLKSYWPFVKDNNGKTDYVKTYRPKSYIDSVVFSVLKYKEVKLGNVRLELARKYEKNKMYDKALAEYEALLATNPYLAINYRDAAANLISLSDLPLALKYFKKSLEYESSFFANYKIGEIYLIKADYDQAVKYFQRAYELAKPEKRIKILAKSYVALVYGNRPNDAQKVAVELKKSNASNALRIPPKEYVYLNYIPYKTRSQVTEARKLISDGKDMEALQMLEKSLLIYNSHVANRLIGEILYRQKSFAKSDDYLNSVYNEFKFDPVFLHQFIILNAQNGKFEIAKKMRVELNNLAPKYQHIDYLNSLNFN